MTLKQPICLLPSGFNLEINILTITATCHCGHASPTWSKSVELLMILHNPVTNWTIPEEGDGHRNKAAQQQTQVTPQSEGGKQRAPQV